MHVTNTQSRYVTLTAFPLQQWLHERASMFRCTYISCLAVSCSPPLFPVLSYMDLVYTFIAYFLKICGPGSSVGVATELRAGRSGIESRWGRDFPPVKTGPGAHSASCKMGTGSFPGVKCGRGMLLTTHPILVPRSLKSRAISLPTLWATPGM